MNKRMLLALVLSFLVLVGYSYLVPNSGQNGVNSGNVTQSSKEVAVAQKQTNDAPSAPKVANSAPVAKSVQKPVNSAPVVDKKQIAQSKIIATVETAKYTLKFDSLGRIESLILKDKKYKTEDGKPLDIIAKRTIKPLEVRFSDKDLNKLAFSNNYSASSANVDATSNASELILEQNLGSVTLKKVFKFYPDGHYDLKVEAGDKEFFITPGFRSIVDKSMYLVVRGVLVLDSNNVSTTLEKGDVDDVKTFNNTVVVAAEDRYYTSLFLKKQGVYLTTVAQSGIKGYEEEPIAFANVKGSESFFAYIGPKEWKLFSKFDPRLENVIEFGWFTFLSRPFFKVMYAIYEFVGNWGWAIVLFTLLVKIILFPLSYKGLMSMQKMKDLAPKMKEIKEKYGKDPAKMNQQMMALYKKHGANPMGGCLPMLLQIPIFFALYRVLLNADELQGAPWIGWITDLSLQDPLYILPILMGITMFIQQKITPNSMTDPTQQKIMQFLPIIMTFFFLTFPAGLVLYWLTNNILTIAQQWYINGAYEKYKKQAKTSAKKSSES